jgi:hypothetical protein
MYSAVVINSETDPTRTYYLPMGVKDAEKEIVTALKTRGVYYRSTQTRTLTKQEYDIAVKHAH